MRSQWRHLSHYSLATWRQTWVSIRESCTYSLLTLTAVDSGCGPTDYSQVIWTAIDVAQQWPKASETRQRTESCGVVGVRQLLLSVAEVELHILTANVDSCQQWLRANRLLAGNMNCHRCGSAMSEGVRSTLTDGVVWRCRCKTTTSIHCRSFFHGSHIPLH